MSIVVYDGSELAVDNTAIHEGTKVPIVKLWTPPNGDVITGVGNAAQIALMKDWYMAGADPATFPKSQAEGNPWCELIVANRKGLKRYERTPSPVDHAFYKCAFGVGKDFAYGAMAVGATAEKAAAAALMFTPDCGNKITVYSWKKPDEEAKAN